MIRRDDATKTPELIEQKTTSSPNIETIIIPEPNTPVHPTDLFTKPQASTPQKVIPENLSTFLRKKDCVDKQRRKFLGTAVWLQLNGKQLIKTKEVTDALRMARQIKITNPSHQLNQNISQGFCQKEGNGFYVTPEGVDNVI